MSVINIKSEYENAVNIFFKLNTLSPSSPSPINDDDMEALIIEVTHKIRVASCLRSTPLVFSLAHRTLTLLNMCYLTVQIEDNGSNRTVERIQNASVEERNIFNHIVTRVAACFGLKSIRDIYAPTLLFGIKPIHELIHPSIPRMEKIRKELEKLMSYKGTYSSSEIREIGFLERINARIKKIHILLEGSTSSSSSSSTVIATPIPLPITPPMTPPITPLTSPSVTPPMTPITISLTSPSMTPPTTPPITPTITTLIDSPGTPPIISSAVISAASRR